MHAWGDNFLGSCSFLQASIPFFLQQSIPASLWPCLPCFKHSPPEDTVFRGTRFHHTSAPMPRPHSPAASSQTAQCGAMANTRALNFSPAALLKEKKVVSITDRKGARTKRQAARAHIGTQLPWSSWSFPCSLFWSRPSFRNWPLPPRALGVSSRGAGRS